MSNIENLKDLIIYQSQNNENISVEVQNIFKTKELEQDSVTQKIRVTASDGKNIIQISIV